MVTLLYLALDIGQLAGIVFRLRIDFRSARSAPVNWAVIKGATETGATLHQMVEKPDAGRLVDQEAVRVVARKGRTLITENKLGIVQAASGIDGSNVDGAELALLPVDPDASAAGLRARILESTGKSVAVVVTDTISSR